MAPGADEYHVPVMVSEVLEGLVGREDGVFVDATAGGGGHSAALLEAAPRARLIAADRDAAAVAATTSRLSRFGGRVRVIQGALSCLVEAVQPLLEAWDADGVDGVLFDLGVSSHQIDEGARGFSFRQDGLLDMRMDRSSGVPVGQLLERIEEADLASIIRRYGEERGYRRIARAICRARDGGAMETTGQLRAAVVSTRPERPEKTLARVFQALRIYVNDELEELRAGLEAAIELLRPGGRLAVISYHSLEDRLTKVRMAELARGCICPPRVPVCTCGRVPSFRPVWRRARRPSEGEVAANPRSRSARLRVAEKL